MNTNLLYLASTALAVLGIALAITMILPIAGVLPPGWFVIGFTGSCGCWGLASAIDGVAYRLDR